MKTKHHSGKEVRHRGDLLNFSDLHVVPLRDEIHRTMCPLLLIVESSARYSPL